MGLLIQPGHLSKLDVTSVAPKTSNRWASATTTDTIERPKWFFTTPAVVSLLT